MRPQRECGVADQTDAPERHVRNLGINDHLYEGLIRHQHHLGELRSKVRERELPHLLEEFLAHAPGRECDLMPAHRNSAGPYDSGEVRIAVTCAFMMVYFAILGIFLFSINEVGTFGQGLVNNLTSLFGVVVGFYFASSAVVEYGRTRAGQTGGATGTGATRDTTETGATGDPPSVSASPPNPSAAASGSTRDANLVSDPRDPGARTPQGAD